MNNKLFSLKGKVKISWVVDEKMQVIPEGYIPTAKLSPVK
jgi:hypothetical protein